MKQWWVPLRSGLILDPRHRKKIGQAVWLLQYLFLYADRSSGGLNRKLGTIAKDLGASEKQIQRWMRALEKHGYVKTRRLWQGYFIAVEKWRPLNSKFSPDTSVQSLKKSSDNTVPVIRQKEDSDRTNLSQPDNSVRPVKSCKQKGKPLSPDNSVRNKEILLKDSTNKKGGTPSTVGEFFKFAQRAHLKIRRIPIVIDSRKDRGRIQGIIDQGVGIRSLKRAWLLFLNDRDRWLEDKPRSIAVFRSQINDYLVRTPDPTPPPQHQTPKMPDKIQAEPQAGELWNKVLEELESELLQQNFDTWLAPTVGLVVNRDQVVIGVPNRFYQRCLQENYVSLIQKSIASAAGFDPGPNIKFEIQDT